MPSNIRPFILHLFYFAIPISIMLAFKFAATPKKQGFFCDDESIRYPHQKDTVRWWQACTLAAVVPFLLICVYFAVLRRRSVKSPLCCSSSAVIGDIYPHVASFIATGLYLNAFIDIFKYGFGRLRPHFFELCAPDIFNGSTHVGDCSSLPSSDMIKFISPYHRNAGLWYTCGGGVGGGGEELSSVKKARQSFPSGHSAVVFYGMLYVIAFCQIHIRRLPAARNILQFACLLSATLIAVSRLSDHAHHPTDVIVGAILGVVAAANAVANPLYLGDEAQTCATTVVAPEEGNNEKPPPSPPPKPSTDRGGSGDGGRDGGRVRGGIAV